MNSSGIQKQIEALSRGEVDVSTLISQIRELLVSSDGSAEVLLAELDEAHRDDTITTRDYTRLTDVIRESTIASPDDGLTIGDTVLVDPDPDEVDDDLEATSIAPPSDEPEEEATSLAESAPEPAGSERSSDEIDVGTRLRDRFILDEVLGVGGMGTVYKGRDALKLEAQDRNPFIAVKILNDRFKQHPEAFIAFQREASRQQRLAHPNIATVYEFHRDGGLMYITMEYLEGRTLDAVIRDEVRASGGMPFADALPIIEDLCAALAHAHRQNIVHADFKPGNCFVTQSNHVKVLDFGIARAMKDPNAAAGDETLFDPRSIGALTPAYASPEMLEGHEDADPRDDIYALACVVYELLSGRHPFGRVPADQAKQNELTVKRIKQLSRRQNEALRRALAFDREKRTPSVQAFLDQLKPDSKRASLAWPIGIVAAGALVVIGLILIPRYLDEFALEERVAQLTSSDPEQIEAGVASLDGLDASLRARILAASSATFMADVETLFDEQMGLADWEVDFPRLGRRLQVGLDLYPDSNRLVGLSEGFQQRRRDHLAALAEQFEAFLTPEHLLPDADARDLPEVLDRLAFVDPGNALLTDGRVQAAYGSAVLEALNAEDYDRARRFLDVGLARVPDDATLSDLRDRLEVIEQELALAATIANLEAELAAQVQATEGLTDLPAVVPAVESLLAIDPENANVAVAGERLVERLAGPLSDVYEGASLPQLEQFRADYESIWRVLEQNGVLERIDARRLALVERQDALTAQVQELIGTASMQRANGTTVFDLIGELRAIDPRSTVPDELVAGVARERLQRARDLVELERWDEARAQLDTTRVLVLPASVTGEIARQYGDIDTLEAEAEDRRIKQEEVAAAQREADRRRAEEEEQRREAERQQRAEDARQAEIVAAAADVDAALRGFNSLGPEEAIRQVQTRMAALERIDSSHSDLARAEAELPRLAAQSVRGMGDPAQALTVLAGVVQLLGENPELARLRADLEAAQAAAAEEQQLARITALEEELAAALANPTALERAEVRRQADRIMTELGNQAGADSDTIREAGRRYVDVFVGEARNLIGAKRFSLARALVDSAARHVPDAPAIGAARGELASAEAQYRDERAREQRIARLQALRQQFGLRVQSGQLEQAEQILAEFRQLEPQDSFVRTVAPDQLAEAYVTRGFEVARAGQLDAGRAALDKAREYVSDSPGVVALDREVEQLALEVDLGRWFSGERSAQPGALLPGIETTRAYRGAGYAGIRDAWARQVADRLRGLQSNPAAYNALLADAQALLPGSQLLSNLAPLKVNTLAVADLFGVWCALGGGQEQRLTMDSKTLRISVDGNSQAPYTVRGYELAGDEILVRWSVRDMNRSSSEDVHYRFGDFSTARDEMVLIAAQFRGTWQAQDRRYRRCD